MSWMLRSRVLFGLGMLMLLISSLLVFREMQVMGIPDAGPPFDVKEWGTIIVADSDNAVSDYRAAAPGLTDPPSSESEAYSAVEESGWGKSSPGLVTWLDMNRPALQRWKAGSAKPAMLAYQPKNVDPSQVVVEIRAFRTIARICTMEAARLESLGRVDEAFDIHRMLFRTSRHCGMYGGMTERLVGQSLSAIAARGLVRWSTHPSLSAAQIKAALAAILADDSMTAPLSNSLKTEYLQIAKFFSGAQSAYWAQKSPFEKKERTGWAGIQHFLRNEPLLSRLLCDQYFANILESVDKPLSVRPPFQPGQPFFSDAAGRTLPPHRLSAERLNALIPRSLHLEEIGIPLDSYIATNDRERGKLAALFVVLAAQAYRREVGSFPETLSAIVELGILDRMPIDPRSKTGDTMRFRRDMNAFVVWGVGENAVDDGGSVEYSEFGAPTDVGYIVPLHPSTDHSNPE